MKVLIQSATILNAASPFHKKTKNILVQNGRIAEIGDKKYPADKVLDARKMMLSPGWCDLGTYVGDPGFEQKEDLVSLAKAAAAGGFTDLALLPNTSPCVQTKNEIRYLNSGNENRLVQFHPLASVTRNNKGEELTEMIDAKTAGAVGFTDGLKPVWHTDIFLKALQYLQKFDGLLIDHPEDVWLNMFGQMHEGTVSTSLGLKGMPDIAEELAIIRNLELLSYAGGRLHFSRLSTARSIDLIRAARKKGLTTTCDIAGYQCLLHDDSLMDFDTNFKVNPPLREKSDREALLKGLNDGTIDVICSGHLPQDDESKNLEFDLADFGIINLQTFAANLTELSAHVKWEVLLEKVTTNPRVLLGLPVPVIDVGQKANLTLIDPSFAWQLDGKTNLSRSKNSPWWGKKVKGRAMAVFNNGRNYSNE
ncbi:MAG: dihydroorotase [Cytophagales bacterium]|nr:dihydroorotase [Cytophagales bacterium]